MAGIRAFFARLHALFRWKKVEDELEEELRFHLEMEAEENGRNGMGREEARRRAKLVLGGIDQTKEACRDREGLPWLASEAAGFRGVRRLEASLLVPP
jgi:hypothetical protein